MSNTISTAFVNQFKSNVFMLVQQKGSRLRPTVRVETQHGDLGFYDQVGAVAAQTRSRHGDSPILDTPHSRRAVTLVDYEWGDLIDQQDKVRLLIDPASAYSQAAMWALGRTMDDVIIAAATGTAATGVAGAGTQALTNGQMVVSKNSDGTGGALNIDALLYAKEILDAGNVDPSIPRYFVLTAANLRSLLTNTQVTSGDYNSVRALVMGQIDTFLGFKFIQTERLGTRGSTLAFDNTSGTEGTVGSGSGDANGYTQCLAFASDGLLLAIGSDMKAEIAPRPDKGFATQVYASLSLGAVRMEEAKVVNVLCNA